MNRRRFSRYRRSRDTAINMAPLIDMIFILLIFFIVTTSFIKESGIEIERPAAQSVEPKEKLHLIIEISKDGKLFIEGKPVDIRFLRSRMKRFMAETPKGSVIIAADKSSQTGTLVRVLDECRLSGVENIGVSARKPTE